MKSKFSYIYKAGIICACLIFLSGFFFRKKDSSALVKVKANKKGGYELFVRGKPFLIKGMIYNPAPVGQGYSYDLFSDPAKPWLKDGKLMQEMGVNAVRVYSCGNGDIALVREFIRDMYEKYGIYTIVGDWLGLWDQPCPEYARPEFREKTKSRVLDLVKDLKDEPGVLMYVLGNENNYTFSGKIAFWSSPDIEQIEGVYQKVIKRAEIYYSFVNDLAREIKKIDSDHPVALGNGEVSMLDVAARVCPDIDILSIISYRGKRFGNLFENIRYAFDRPVMLLEFGADAYDSYKQEEAEDIQAEYLTLQWSDIARNTTGCGNEQGNCLGGTLFEWTDEWWKHNEGYSPDWFVHNKEGGWSNGSYYYDIRVAGNMNMSEEWFGIVKLSPDQTGKGMDKRIPRKAYYLMKDIWTSKNWCPPEK